MFLNDNEEVTVLEKVNECVASDSLRDSCANVDTLTNKIDELSIRVIREHPDVICLQEVLPKNTSELLVRPLTMIFNKSFKEGVLGPTDLMERGRSSANFQERKNIIIGLTSGCGKSWRKSRGRR